jgi:aspartate/glutamate racemase
LDLNLNGFRPNPAERIILGCAVFPIILGQRDAALLVFDGNMNHIITAVDYALS